MTITTSSAHGLVAGQTVLIAGFSGAYAGYNGTFTVASVPTTTTFTYTDSTTGLGKSGGGTATGYGLTESGNTVTVWTTVANQLTVNEPVTISGAGVAGYNGTFTVTSLPGGANGTTFTYTDTNTGLANSGGGTAALARGIPISLSGPTSGVTSGTFTLTYSSSDLTISGAVVDPSLAASYGATLSLDASSTPGNAIIDFSTTTALPSASSTPILLGGLMATVPSTAYYKAKDLLHFSSVSLKYGRRFRGGDRHRRFAPGYLRGQRVRLGGDHQRGRVGHGAGGGGGGRGFCRLPAGRPGRYRRPVGRRDGGRARRRFAGPVRQRGHDPADAGLSRRSGEQAQRRGFDGRGHGINRCRKQGGRYASCAVRPHAEREEYDSSAWGWRQRDGADDCGRDDAAGAGGLGHEAIRLGAVVPTMAESLVSGTRGPRAAATADASLRSWEVSRSPPSIRS